jgi:4-amino-4-deoxy-L-arabinose transferase-like glycosyltransferase
VNTRNRWGQAPAGWEAPGWAPLVDPDPRPLQTARSVGRWLWPTAAVSGFLVVTAFVLAHDNPSPGLSVRGLITIALAAVVVVLLTIRRSAGPGPLARAVVEYTVVFVLAVLVATTGVPVDRPTAASSPASAADQRPALVKTIDSFRDWLGEWRQWARTETNRQARAGSTTLGPGQ